MIKLNDQPIWQQIILILAVIAICIGIGTVIGKQTAQNEIQHWRTVVKKLDDASVKKTALIIGYTEGLIDGPTALTMYFESTPFSFRNQWNTITNTGKSPLRLVQEQMVLQYIKDAHVYNIPSSNYVMKVFDRYYNYKRAKK